MHISHIVAVSPRTGDVYSLCKGEGKLARGPHLTPSGFSHELPKFRCKVCAAVTLIQGKGGVYVPTKRDATIAQAHVIA